MAGDDEDERERLMSHAARELLPKTGKYSRAWWIDTADRVISTAAQSAIAVMTVGGIAPSLLTIDFPTVAGIAGGASVLAFLKALAISRV